MTTTRKVTRLALVGHQLATEIMLQRTLQAMLGFVPREARPELLRAMREAAEQSVTSIDLGEAAATEEARTAAALALSAVFDPLEAEVARTGPKPPMQS